MEKPCVIFGAPANTLEDAVFKALAAAVASIAVIA
jgi:hypothetical protein